MSTPPADAAYPSSVAWFGPCADLPAAQAAGFRLAGGGGHQSKTMMLEELSAVLAAAEVHGMAGAVTLVESENLLGKTSAAARDSAYVNLNKLYALRAQPPITSALVRLWTDAASRPLLALLCALARDPLLRDTAQVVLGAPIGEPLRYPRLTEVLAALHPDRFSPATLKSLAQNCASTWTQSGHLTGRLNKVRTRAQATPEAAAYAGLLARKAGFGGPALLNSPWLAVLDVPSEERLSLLRQAQGRGLVRVRQGGGVMDIEASAALAVAD